MQKLHARRTANLMHTILDDLAIAQHDVASGVGGNLPLMSHQHDGVSRLVQVSKQLHDVAARGAVQISGWFVGQQNVR